MSNISRSVYQTLKEENNRLLRDIRILCDVKYSLSNEKTKVIMKWRQKFKKEKELNHLIQLAVQEHLKENPELKKKIESFGKNNKQ